MSHFTLSHTNVFAVSRRSSNRSASFVMGLLLLLVFGPMLAMHIGMRMSTVDLPDVVSVPTTVTVAQG